MRATVSNQLRGVDGQNAPLAMSHLSKKDDEVLSRLFEMVGMCEAVVGIRFNKTAPRPDNKHLGRLIEQIAYHVREVSNELHEFARAWEYE